MTLLVQIEIANYHRKKILRISPRIKYTENIANDGLNQIQWNKNPRRIKFEIFPKCISIHTEFELDKVLLASPRQKHRMLLRLDVSTFNDISPSPQLLPIAFVLAAGRNKIHIKLNSFNSVPRR